MLAGELANIGAERAKQASLFQSYQETIETQLQEERRKAAALETEKLRAEQELARPKPHRTKPPNGKSS